MYQPSGRLAPRFGEILKQESGFLIIADLKIFAQNWRLDDTPHLEHIGLHAAVGFVIIDPQ